MTDEQTTWLKLAAGVIVGGLVSLQNMPGNWLQRMGAFALSVGIGVIAGMAAIEFFKLAYSSWSAVATVAVATAFGYAVAMNAMQQIPEVIAAIRRKFLGS